MKATIFSGLALTGTFLLPVNAFAAMSFDDLATVTKIAYDDFKTAHPEHLEHFTGYKSWQSNNDGKVKIYVNHNGMAMEFNYTCQSLDTGLACQADQ